MAFDNPQMEMFLPVTVVGVVTAFLAPVLQDLGMSFWQSLFLGMLCGGVLVGLVFVAFNVAERMDKKDK
ncbi:MAG: hypothetical protein OEL66_10655 [Desulfobulbaceae bacterium]|nr:hypothetical protein [Desulfobulbaceae bacterium]